MLISSRKIGFPGKFHGEMFNFSRKEISLVFSSFCEKKKKLIEDQCASFCASYHTNVRALIRNEKKVYISIYKAIYC